MRRRIMGGGKYSLAPASIASTCGSFKIIDMKVGDIVSTGKYVMGNPEQVRCTVQNRSLKPVIISAIVKGARIAEKIIFDKVELLPNAQVTDTIMVTSGDINMNTIRNK